MRPPPPPRTPPSKPPPTPEARELFSQVLQAEADENSIDRRESPRHDCRAPMPIEPGTKLGPYEIVAPLGAGGMGEVYKAADTRLNRIVAIKVLPPHFSVDPE